MGVIIHDFEVVPEPAPTPTTAAPTAPPAKGNAPAKHEVARLVRHEARRLARVTAG